MKQLNALHITHEAIKKVGGIGAVIHGLLTTPSYQNNIKRTILVGPLFSIEVPPLGENSTILYSRRFSIYNTLYSEKFKEIENTYNVEILYGKRIITDEFNQKNKSEAEVIAVDIKQMRKDKIDLFKYLLYENFKIDSMKYENDFDYEQYIRIGVIYPEIVRVLINSEPSIHWGHEYMGVPALLSVEIARRKGKRKKDMIIFHAHEVSTTRMIVENLHGHDVSFYNLLRMDFPGGISLEEEFGDHSWHYRTVLIKQHRAFDYIIAVGDLVKEEYRYLSPDVEEKKIIVPYNGVPLRKIDIMQKNKSEKKIRNFCKNLVGFEPDIIFTHVARLVVSKGIWRDLKILFFLDQLFHQSRLKGCYILLSSLVVTGRPPDAVREMEKYGWPLQHRRGWPDLVNLEIPIADAFDNFNLRSLAIKSVFINQFGFSRENVGETVPIDTNFLDLRISSAVEFGQSVYEPFGIAPLEVLPFGGIAVISSAAGAAFLLKEECPKNLCHMVVDYITLPEDLEKLYSSREKIKNITISQRDIIEERVAKASAGALFKILLSYTSEKEKRLKIQENLTERLSWERTSSKIFNSISHHQTM